jgi:TonB family protein
MNAAIRAVVRSGCESGMRVMGIRRGYKGLIEGDMFEMNLRSVSDIIHRGGTMLYSARCPEFAESEVQEMLRSLVSNENADRNNRRTSATQDLEQYIEETLNEINGHKGSDLYKAQRDNNFKRDSLQHISDKLEQELDSLKSTFYQDGSSVSYKLGNRYARKLPIPVFKCENGGKIVVDIQVNPNGRVVKATVNPASDPDEQLQETAVDAALRALFNAKGDAPALEYGTITYNFVKQ